MAHGVWTHNDIIKLALIGSHSGQAVVNVFHFEVASAAQVPDNDDAGAQVLAANLVADWHTNNKTTWLACHTTGYSLLRAQVQIVERHNSRNRRLTAQDSTTGLPAAGTFNPGGQNNIDSLLTDAAVVRWRTDIAGRSHRGRTYVGPLPQGQVTNGVIGAGFLTPLNAWRDAFFARYKVGGTTQAIQFSTIYSRPFDQGTYGYVRGQGANRAMYFPPDYAGNSTGITSCSTDSNARTMRRRELGVGS